MSQETNIEMLLSNGTLSGLIRAESGQWKGVMLCAPRESFYLLSNQREASFAGIYLLLSQEKVYIGQASGLLKRTKEHDNSSLQKDWWEKVVLFSTKDNWLSRTYIDYLESVLIEKAREAGSLEVENKKSGNSSIISVFDEIKLNDYIKGAMLMVELIGENVFKRKSKKPRGKTVNPRGDDPTNVVIDKVKAKEIFESRAKLLNIDFMTFATYQDNRKYYWANTSPDCLTKNWYIILNNKKERKLYLLNVPSMSLKLSINGSKGMKTRKDNGRLELQFQDITFIENHSGISFKTYIIDELEY